MRYQRHHNPFELPTGGSTKHYYVKDSTKDRWYEFGSGNRSSKGGAKGLFGATLVTTWWLVVVFSGLGILTARTAYLQIVQGSYYSEVAEGNRIRIHDLKASRGVIYDRHGELMVENIGTFALAIVPVDLPKDAVERENIALALDEMSKKNKQEIIQIISEQSPYSYIPVEIEENLSHEQAVAIQVQISKYPGVILKDTNRRHYIFSQEYPSFSHILGYEGKIEESKLQDYLEKNYSIDDRVGKTGIELSYEKELKGTNGKEQVEVDATGVSKEIIASDKPIAGMNLTLTIDAELQKQAEQILRDNLEIHGKQRGSVIALDPRNGEVLAMVNWPSFDNNLFSLGISQEDYARLINDENHPMFSRAISGEYASGSTFKLIVAAAALEEGIINQSTGFNSTGGVWVGRWHFPDWQAGGHGHTTVVKAIAQSVNTFFYIIGGGYNGFMGLGPDLIKKYAEKFGLSERYGIDLPNESAGFIPSEEWKEKTKNEQWYIGDTYNFSIGQGDLLVTPLQVAMWTSVFANGGILYQPHVVKSMQDSNGNIVEEKKSVIINQGFISNENIKLVAEGLRSAVTTGSARRLSLLPISAAGKTGTAQWSSTKDPHAWFTSFAPYENPEIVVTVMVEEGKEGSTVGSPIAYEILRWWAENRYLNKEEKIEELDEQ